MALVSASRAEGGLVAGWDGFGVSTMSNLDRSCTELELGMGFDLKQNELVLGAILVPSSELQAGANVDQKLRLAGKACLAPVRQP